MWWFLTILSSLSLQKFFQLVVYLPTAKGQSLSQHRSDWQRVLRWFSSLLTSSLLLFSSFPGTYWSSIPCKVSKYDTRQRIKYIKYKYWHKYKYKRQIQIHIQIQVNHEASPANIQNITMERRRRAKIHIICFPFNRLNRILSFVRISYKCISIFVCICFKAK